MAFWHGISSRINTGVRKKNDALVAVVFACVYAFFLIVFTFCIIGGVSTDQISCASKLRRWTCLYLYIDTTDRLTVFLIMPMKEIARMRMTSEFLGLVIDRL
jgi:hypothetical protein